MKQLVHVVAKSVEDLVRLSQALGLFVFRGQASASWALETSIERAFSRSSDHLHALENTEYWMLHEFRRRSHLYSTNLPEPTNIFEWLALMQHYGGATRLLDFTESIYIAAFFALADSSDDAAIWAISRPLLKDSLLEKYSPNYRKGKDLKDVINRAHVNLFNSHVARPGSLKDCMCLKHLVPLESELLFDRASKQKSLFLAAGYLGDSRHPFTYMDNLASTFCGSGGSLEAGETIGLSELCGQAALEPCYDNYCVIKILIPLSCQKKIRAELSLMGLSAESMFPGLEGLCKSIVQSQIIK